ncbi:trihelix transcription factor ASIL2-like [Punica granatum]|uniref:Myb/SANT-like DNA-binding domain-containing protein n=2 Tax=Punica granatum TaxID=22663 RepID=A0A218XYN7_PUNGR|nr:trihelix transcription factor ASIL2-like [Punica granatum]OWM89918.1 hypothetical protein CDL15_Pgr012555 [Punica granatum]PKI50791.1 hypothetical protein CRG98_028786 [Punica granatum]
MAEPYSFRQSKKSSHRTKLPFDYQNPYPSYEGYGGESDRQPPKRQRLDGVEQEYAPNSSGGPSIWTDQLSFLLLDVWGQRFLELGRRSLRSEDWVEVAEKVTLKSRVEVSEVDCRQQLDKLKRKYRKIRSDSTGMANYGWKFYKKMDMLLGMEMEEDGPPLPCGIDSGEYCFADTRVYLNRSNAFDEMRDSPCESEEMEDDEEEEEEEDDDLPPRRKLGGDGEEGMRVLADSIERFGKLYERIESDKREQMMELRKMRADFDRELELQKEEILEKASAEIAKLRAGADGSDDNDSNDEINEEDEEEENRDDDDDGEEEDGCNGV